MLSDRLTLRTPIIFFLGPGINYGLGTPLAGTIPTLFTYILGLDVPNLAFSLKILYTIFTMNALAIQNLV